MSDRGDLTEALLDIMATLRHPDVGCPWDVKQTFETIAPYTVEEAYEVADAIHQGDMAALQDELGDLMFQVVFHARMAEEAGAFTYADVIQGVCDKMVRRHPHVFADDGAIDTADAQTQNWEEIKAAERRAKDAADPSSLAGVPLALPALARAEKLQKRAARVGFDWADLGPVIAKIREELAEVEAELAPQSPQERRVEEVGDLLFAVANLARHLKVDPETALHATNRKFDARFRRVEQDLAAAGTPVTAPETTLDMMDAAWNRAKSKD